MKYHAPYGSTDANASYVDKDTPGAVRGSVPPAAAIETPQREIVDVIAAADLTPADGLQLLSALQRLGLASGTAARRWLNVLSMSLSSPPASPAAGDAYLIPSGATGVWAGQSGLIAEWNGGAWRYLTPTDGHGISLPDGRVFERISGAYVEKLAIDVQSGKWNYVVAGGTANALTVTLSPAPTALTDGMQIRIKTPSANTTAVTINVNGLGAVSVVTQALDAFTGGEFTAAGLAVLQYNAALNAWVLQASTGISHSVTPAVTDSSTKVATTSWVNSALGTIFTALGFTYSFGTTGYFKFPSIMASLIVEWGNTTTSSGSVVVTRPLAFPTQNLVTMATLKTTIVDSRFIVGTDDGSLTQFTITSCSATDGSGVTVGVRWLSIGR